jgi:hypothetical protein
MDQKRLKQNAHLHLIRGNETHKVAVECFAIYTVPRHL